MQHKATQRQSGLPGKAVALSVIPKENGRKDDIYLPASDR